MARFALDQRGMEVVPSPTGVAGPPGPPGSGGGLNGWVDVTQAPYNADPTGATDSSAGFQAAINAVMAAGGVVYVPPGNYHIATTLNANANAKAWALRGPDSGAQYQQMAANLIYTGTASGPTGGLIHFNHAATAFELAYLGLQYNNAGFTGDLVNVDGQSAGDCQVWHIHHCATRTLGTITARSTIRLNQCVICQIDHCHLTGAVNPLRIGDPGGSYVNSLAVEYCTFNFATDAMILIGTADGEAIQINYCAFEAGTNTTAIRGATVARDGNANQLYNPVIAYNWFGDASGTTVWIDSLATTSSAYTGLIIGNRFAGFGAGSTHLRLDGKWVIDSNSFEDGTVLDANSPLSAQYITRGNYYASITQVLNPTSFPNGVNTPGVYYAMGNQNERDITVGQIGLSGNVATIQPHSQANLCIGAQANAAPPAGATLRANIFYGPSNKFQGGNTLYLQAPWDTTGTGFGSIQFVAGTAPQSVIEVRDQKLGFYTGTTAVAQAARAGQLTDSTGGTVTSTLAAGITDTVAKNAIASLAAKVNALETIIHNLGLSA